MKENGDTLIRELGTSEGDAMEVPRSFGVPQDDEGRTRGGRLLQPPISQINTDERQFIGVHR